MNFHVPKAMHDMVFESEPDPIKPASSNPPTTGRPTEQVPPTSFTPSPQVYIPSNVQTVTTSSDNDAYKVLCAHINFETTDVFLKLNKYLAPLASTNLDEKTKFSVAWNQAKAIDGLTPEAFMAAFDNLLAQLGQEGQNFQTWLQGQTDSLVTPKAQQIDQLSTHIADLNRQIQEASTQIQTVSSDKADAEAKITKAKSQFDSAFSLHQSEVTALKAKYSSLLG
jgi:outer membrane murein-binding lipoprotein Lpp